MIVAHQAEISTKLMDVLGAILHNSGYVKQTYAKETPLSVLKSMDKIETGHLQSTKPDFDVKGHLQNVIVTTIDGDLMIDLIKEVFGREVTDQTSFDYEGILDMLHNSFFPNVGSVSYYTGIAKVAESYDVDATKGGRMFKSPEGAVKGVLRRAQHMSEVSPKTKFYKKQLKEICQIMHQNPVIHEDVTVELFGDSALEKMNLVHRDDRFEKFIKTIIARNTFEANAAMVDKMKESHVMAPYIRFMGTDHMLGQTVTCNNTVEDHIRYVENEINSPQHRAVATRRIVSFVHRSPFQKEIADWLIPDILKEEFEQADNRRRGLIFDDVLKHRLLENVKPKLSAIPGYDGHQERDPKPTAEKEPAKKYDQAAMITANLSEFLSQIDTTGLSIQDVIQNAVLQGIWPNIESVPNEFIRALIKGGLKSGDEEVDTGINGVKFKVAKLNDNNINWQVPGLGEHIDQANKQFSWTDIFNKSPETCNDPRCPACGNGSMEDQNTTQSPYFLLGRLGLPLGEIPTSHPNNQMAMLNLADILSRSAQDNPRHAVDDLWSHYDFNSQENHTSDIIGDILFSLKKHEEVKPALTMFEDTIIHNGRTFNVSYHSDNGKIVIEYDNKGKLERFGTVGVHDVGHALRKVAAFKHAVVTGKEIHDAYRVALITG